MITCKTRPDHNRTRYFDRVALECTYSAKKMYTHVYIQAHAQKRMGVAEVNTYLIFKKSEKHRMTYESGGRSTLVEYVTLF